MTVLNQKKSYKNTIKLLEKELVDDDYLLIQFRDLINGLKGELGNHKKQRDELINDMAETKRKAKAFDEILEMAEEDCWAEDFAVYISQVVDKYKEVDHEG
ncbi:hypothetical protein K4T26_05330 [Staphylococcus epidermidis]|nr:hypothetical protein [Staphylococcus epidermidis]